MTRRGWICLLGGVLLVGAIGFAGCGEDEPVTGDGNANTGGTTHEVRIENFSFVPAALTIAVGDTVRWTNVDTTPHTATAGQSGAETGDFDSGSLDQDAVFSQTFGSAGDFAYFCRFHPAMTANVSVE